VGCSGQAYLRFEAEAVNGPDAKVVSIDETTRTAVVQLSCVVGNTDVQPGDLLYLRAQNLARCGSYYCTNGPRGAFAFDAFALISIVSIISFAIGWASRSWLAI
jgi:hypothetical protein